MTPPHHRAALQPGCWWVAYEHNGHLTVLLSNRVKPGSATEADLLRNAVRRWNRRRRWRGLLLLPLAAGAARWILDKARGTQTATAAAAAGVAAATAAGLVYAVASDAPTSRGEHRPPAAAAPPPTRQPAPAPTPAPSTPAPKPKPPARTAPPKGGMFAGSPAAPPVVAVVSPLRTVRHLVSPRHPRRSPPSVVVPRPSRPVLSPPAPSRCRLVRVEVGRLVRVCV